MSLAGYTKARQQYVAGDNAALERMVRHITKPVAAKLAEIEREAALACARQRQAEEFAAAVQAAGEQAARLAARRLRCYEARSVVVLAMWIIGLVVAAVGAICMWIYFLSLASATIHIHR